MWPSRGAIGPAKSASRNGKLQDFARHDWIFATSDSEGRYRFDGASMRRANPPIGKYGVFAYHAKGYARKSAEELEFSGDLTLEPWGRVEGTVTVLGKPLANQALRFTLDATDEHSMFYDYYEYEARTDDRGRFTVEHVPAGVAHVSTGTSHRKEPGPYGIVSSPRKLIKAGETLTLNIGGAGRLVEGKAPRTRSDPREPGRRPTGPEDGRQTRAAQAAGGTDEDDEAG